MLGADVAQNAQQPLTLAAGPRERRRALEARMRNAESPCQRDGEVARKIREENVTARIKAFKQVSVCFKEWCLTVRVPDGSEMLRRPVGAPIDGNVFNRRSELLASF